MQQITPEDIFPPAIYGSRREEITKNIIAEKRRRRVVTKTFSFLFESRNTVINQVNEMVFIENVQDQKEIDRLIRVYSEQLPTSDELSVSMFIEFVDEKQMVREIPKLAGIENSVFITFDGREIHGTPEEGRSTEVLESTLQYLKFKFTKEDLEKFKTSKNVFIETKKEGYSEAARLSPELVTELAGDLNF